MAGRMMPQANHVDDSLMPIMLAPAYVGLGKNGLALAQAQRAVELYRSDAIYRPYAEWTLAQVLAMNGDHASAIVGLEKSLQVPAGVTLAQLRLDPFWDPLRKDPRFQKLIDEGDVVTMAKAKP